MTVRARHVAAAASSAVLLTTLAGLGSPASAVGVERWASPTGSGSDCTQVSPCDLVTAAGAMAADGDEVIVMPGSYSIASVTISHVIDLHGQAGQPRPTIAVTGSIGVWIAAAATVRDLTITSTTSGQPLFVQVASTVDRVVVSTSFAGAVACVVGASAVVRDSVCRATGVNSIGLGASTTPGPAPVAVVLRNVTAVGVNAGIEFSLYGAGQGPSWTIDVKNSIAQGGSTDLRAGANADASVAITLAHSNYATEVGNAGAIGTNTATVTDPGTGTNQTAPPVFVDAAAGDFHQNSGSPTVDAGTLDGSTGPQDVDGDPRALRGSAAAACPSVPDIGADELVTPFDCDPPDTTITGPTTTTDPTPAFVLASTDPGSVFECRVDAAVFAACASPYTTAVLTPGAHTVQARAIDPWGNVDPSPASTSVTMVSPALPPDTTITKQPNRRVTTPHRRTRVAFSFASSTSATFQCSLDAGAFTACTSPTRVRVGAGRHTFAVRAVDARGAVDATPATATFKVRVRPGPRG